MGKDAAVARRCSNRVDVLDATLQFVSDGDIGRQPANAGEVLLERHGGRFQKLRLEWRIVLGQDLGEQQPSTADRTRYARCRVRVLHHLSKIADVFAHVFRAQRRCVVLRTSDAFRPTRASNERGFQELFPLVFEGIAVRQSVSRAMFQRKAHQFEKLPAKEQTE